MRRILRKIANNQPDEIGDVSTLADPSVVQKLVVRGKNNIKNAAILKWTFCIWIFTSRTQTSLLSDLGIGLSFKVFGQHNRRQ